MTDKPKFDRTECVAYICLTILVLAIFAMAAFLTWRVTSDRLAATQPKQEARP